MHVSCTQAMSSIDFDCLDVLLLLECGSFWPDSLVERSSFMQMLAHAMNVEAPDIDRWEEELTASGACNASGLVDVNRFVAFCLQGGVERAETVLPGQLPRPQEEYEDVGDSFTIQEGDKREAATSFIASQGKLEGIIRNPDRSLSFSELATAIIGEQIPPPPLEDKAGVVVVVDSKQYVLGERLGQGGTGE
eukprot:236407-Amphidinium_carterae.1